MLGRLVPSRLVGDSIAIIGALGGVLMLVVSKLQRESMVLSLYTLLWTAAACASFFVAAAIFDPQPPTLSFDGTHGACSALIAGMVVVSMIVHCTISESRHVGTIWTGWLQLAMLVHFASVPVGMYKSIPGCTRGASRPRVAVQAFLACCGQSTGLAPLWQARCPPSLATWATWRSSNTLMPW